MNKNILTCLLGLLIAFRVFGQDVVERTDSTFRNGETGDTEIAARLQMICNLLDQNEKGAETWWYGWLGLYGAATLGQGVLAFLTEDQSTKEDMILGAGTTLFGVAGQLIAPVKSGYNAKQFEQRDDTSKEELLKSLNRAEAMLKFQAERAKSGKNWRAHAMSGAVNLSSGLITWIGFKRSVWAGIGNFAFNTVITEIQIWSQPTRAMKKYRQYCNMYGLTDDYQHSKKTEFEWCAYVQPGGVGLEISF